MVGSCDKEGEESVHLWERCPFPSLLRARVLGNVEKEGPISAGGGAGTGTGATASWRALNAESEGWVQVSQCPGWVSANAVHLPWALASSSVKQGL